MKFGFVINEEKDPGFAFSKRAAEIVSSKGGSVVFDDSFRGSVLDDIPGVTFGSYSDCDILFSLGGDGTFFVPLINILVRRSR